MQITPNYYDKLRSWLETSDCLKAQSCPVPSQQPGRGAGNNPRKGGGGIKILKPKGRRRSAERTALEMARL